VISVKRKSDFHFAGILISDDKNIHFLYFKKLFLSSSSKTLFNLYVPEFLDYLVKAVNLFDSEYFQSHYTIIEKMTVFPFYSIFVDRDIKTEFYNYFRGATTVRSTENAFNIRDVDTYYEGALQIKICELCIQEKETFYLDREHQIQDNFICYKHNTILETTKWKRYKSYIINELDTLDYEKCIEDNDEYLDVRCYASNYSSHLR